MKKRQKVIATLSAATKSVINENNPNKQILYSQMDMYRKTVVAHLKPTKKETLRQQRQTRKLVKNYRKSQINNQKHL